MVIPNAHFHNPKKTGLVSMTFSRDGSGTSIFYDRPSIHDISRDGSGSNILQIGLVSMTLVGTGLDQIIHFAALHVHSLPGHLIGL